MGKIKIPITVKGQFELYLKLVKLDPSQMSRTQLRETKRAFYGAAGTMIAAMQEIGHKYPNDIGRGVDPLLKEINTFWVTQNNNPQSN